MQLKKLGPNETEVTQHGFIVLYSYSTPVAARSIDDTCEFRTSKRFSKTTSKHINKWCSKNAQEIDQARLEQLINGQ